MELSLDTTELSFPSSKEKRVKDSSKKRRPAIRQSLEQGTLHILPRLFTHTGSQAVDTVSWATHQVEILNDRGETLFSQQNVTAPDFWSTTAVSVVASKYFRGAKNSPERESGIADLINRVTSPIVQWIREDGYLPSASDQESFREELSYLLLHQMSAFNSPVWFNVGVEPRPQCSACFILSVDDSLDSLLNLQATEGRLFKFGSGAGTNFSTIRSSRETLKGGGRPSGPVSFMRGYDAWASTIKSGGKTRRAAKMQILNVTHPDILDFIQAKSVEEQKAWALIEQGYDGGFCIPGGAYDSVAFQNANFSVRITDDFMEKVLSDGWYETIEVASGNPCEKLKAREVLLEISKATHLCGDPGVQFHDVINEWHTCPVSGPIQASNPCSEYMHLDNSACNLSSLNLLSFFDDEGEFQIERFQHAIAIMITAQDALIERSSYPTEAIEKCARQFRQLGLGYSNLGAMLMSLGCGYDSAQGRAWAAVVTALMTGTAYRTSAELARRVGPFEGFQKNRAAMLGVIEKHQLACDAIDSALVPPKLLSSAKEAWEQAATLGALYGYRNSQTTVLAPTGTISFMMDCDTTGIEPELALTKYKKLSGGGMLKLVNRTVPAALKKLGYSHSEQHSILEHIREHDTIEGAQALNPYHLAIFDCALKPQNGVRSISYQGHLQMMAAVQPYLSGAISKTVNLPSETTIDEIYRVYVAAWQMGLKAVALYRDGSKRTQPLSQFKDSPEEKDAAQKPVRRRLPEERAALTHKFSISGLEGYLTVGMYEDGAPGEIFLVVAKEGSTLSGITDAFATAVSIALQYGVPLKVLVKKFSHMRFEPAGLTRSKEIPIAKSIIDYVFSWLAIKFLLPEEQQELGIQNRAVYGGASEVKKFAQGKETSFIASVEKQTSLRVEESLQVTFQNMEDAPPCTNCGSSLMVRQAGCYVCLNCGSQGGCG